MDFAISQIDGFCHQPARHQKEKLHADISMIEKCHRGIPDHSDYLFLVPQVQVDMKENNDRRKYKTQEFYTAVFLLCVCLIVHFCDTIPFLCVFFFSITFLIFLIQVKEYSTCTQKCKLHRIIHGFNFSTKNLPERALIVMSQPNLFRGDYYLFTYE